MAEILLRRGVSEGAAALFSIHKESAVSAYVQVFPPDRYTFPDEEMRSHWAETLRDPETQAVVAEREGTPVGFVTVSPGWLRNLFVVPAEWGGGAGAALHDEAVRLLGELGEGARLWVLEANARARRFYERRGWRPDGEEGKSEFPPYPRTLRYSLEVGAGAGLDPSLSPTHPRG